MEGTSVCCEDGTVQDKCRHMVYMLKKYKQSLVPKIEGSIGDIIGKIENDVRTSDFKIWGRLWDSEEQTSAVLDYIVQELQVFRTNPFESLLEVLMESLSDVGHILEKEWKSLTEVRPSLEAIINAVKRHDGDTHSVSDLIKEGGPLLKHCMLLKHSNVLREPSTSVNDETMQKEYLFSLFLEVIYTLRPETTDQLMQIHKKICATDCKVNDELSNLQGLDKYKERLVKNKTFIIDHLSCEDLDAIQPKHHEPGIVFQLEASSESELIDNIVNELDKQKTTLLNPFLTATKDSNSAVYALLGDRCRFGLNTLKEKLPNILKVELPLVEQIIQKLSKHLTQDRKEHLESKITAGDKMAKLCDILRKSLKSQEEGLFEKFLIILAGLDPKLFEELVYRPPSIEEVTQCIEDDHLELKATIKKEGHQKDKSTDIKIDLEKHYVKLRLIPSEEHLAPEHPAAYQASLIRGDRDIEDVLMDKQGKFCLIQGRCGIGKTTMTQHLCVRWSNNKCLAQFRFIFHIPIRRVVMVEKLSLYDILTKYSIYTNRLPSHWLANWSEYVLLTLDGLDEFEILTDYMTNLRKITDIFERASPREICLNLLKRNLLPGISLVCTSRPFEELKVLRPDLKFEVMGLTQDAVHEFIEKNVPEENKDMVESKLMGNPILLSVCSITFYAAHLCRVLARSESEPEKYLDTYSRLTAFLVSEYPKRQNDSAIEQAKFENCYKTLAKLARHAEEGVKKNALTKISFDWDQLKEVCTNEDLDHIKTARENGIIHITEFKVDGETKKILEYPHLSIQEFFAALQILRDESASSTNMLQELLKGDTMNMLQLFLFGAAFDQEKSQLAVIRKKVVEEADVSSCLLNTLHERFNKSMSERTSKTAFLSAVQIAHETQNDDFVRKVGQQMSQHLAFNNTPLNAMDIKGLAFVFKKCHISKLVLSNTNLDNYSVEMLADLFKENAHLRHLDLSENQLSEIGLSSISQLLESNSKLDEVVLDGNRITNKTVNNILPGLGKQRKHIRISLARNDIKSDGFAIIFSSLHQTESADLNLDGNLKKDEISSMEHRVPSHKKGVLRFFRLKCAEINKEVMAHLGELVKASPCLEMLKLDDNNISSAVLKPLLPSLAVSRKSLHLSLQNNKIDWRGAVELLYFLGQISEVELDLSQNEVNEEAHPWYTQGITQNHSTTSPIVSPKLQSFVLTADNILMALKVIPRLADRVKHVSSLKYVCLKGMHIDQKDSWNIVKEFRTCKTPLTVDFDQDQIIVKKMSQLASDSGHILCLSNRNLTDRDIKDLMPGLIQKNVFAEIDLQQNKLTKESIMVLTFLSFGLTRLRSLNVSKTKINNDHQEAFLKMDRDKLNKLDDSLQWEALEFKDVSEFLLKLRQTVEANEIRNIELHKGNVACILADSKSKKRAVSLNQVGINDGKDQVLIAAIKVKRSLTIIDMSGDKLVQKLVLGMAETLKLGKSILFSGIQLRDEGALAVAEALKASQSLTRIDISGNGLTGNVVLDLAESIKINKSITHIDVSRNAMGGMAVTALADALKVNQTIEEIDLSSNYICHDGALALADALRVNKSITCINLSFNGMEDPEGSALAQTLLENDSINDIDLSCNEIGEEGGLAFAKALKGNNHITKFSLSGNQIGPEAGLALIEALTVNQSITAISLWGIELGSNTGHGIGAALTKNLSIVSIDLSRNRIGADATRGLMRELKEHTSLRDVNLSGNGINCKENQSVKFEING